jgi:hypothetical protein
MKRKKIKAAARLWRIELESGDAFTLEACDRGEAIEKAIKYRGRASRVAKVENVAELIAAGKL